ncbi:outer membrane protease [Methyloligella halotolerans]|uniref:Outer membrane protease n=1 Tax=Methyloligella halotolerans TaxID=1177755 RepID=A0A1E2RZX7_9HYPH|nr:outer membrane beta-barrel protein [Methyloligella halotolerans]ODA67774.1 outer membrane protease [Methyloligella halotolerans]
MAGRAGALLFTLLLPIGLATPAVAETPQPFDWTGFYLGYHTGGALDLADVSDPFGAPIFGDEVRSPGPIHGGQIGYSWQSGSFVYGLEAEASLADLEGTNSCFAYSGFYVSANCRRKIDAMGTLTARAGFLLDPDTLVYGKAGLALVYSETTAAPNAEAGAAVRDSGTDFGWTVGAGMERAIGGGWSLKAEYAYLSYDADLSAPASVAQAAPPNGPFGVVAGGPSGLSSDLHQVKLGANYRFGQPGDVALFRPVTEPGMAPGYSLEVGARYTYGWGQFHKDLGLQGKGDYSLASRLTYENTDSNGGEVFARLDTPSGVMVKGVLGGATSGGKMNDEDWDLQFPAAAIPYSNTVSTVDNEIKYGTVDVGYAWWRGQRYSIAPFIGYSQFRQDMDADGCRQIANPNSDCATEIPTSVLGISEDDVWHALRLGSAVTFDVTQRLTFQGEAAYLPYVDFDGTDDHVLRSLVSPESGRGIGVQLEATLSYALTDAFSLGVGGRYWSMWTETGNVNFGGDGIIIPMRYASEQAQLLFQGSYRFSTGGGS